MPDTHPDFTPCAAEEIYDIIAIVAEQVRNRPRAKTGHIIRDETGEHHVAERPPR